MAYTRKGSEKMGELDLLCKLETHHNSLEIYKKNLQELQETIFMDELRKEILVKEKTLKDLMAKKEKIKLKSRKIEKRLKEYTYKIEDIESKLYSGETRNVTQLEKWNMEKNNIKEIISSTETEILELMEKTEEIENTLVSLEKALDEIKEKYEKQLIKYKRKKEDLNESIGIEIKHIKELEKTINSTLLKRYNLIRKNNKTAVAQVNEGICSGCRTGVSTYMLEEIKKKEEIIYCEFCGRILFKE